MVCGRFYAVGRAAVTAQFYALRGAVEVGKGLAGRGRVDDVFKVLLQGIYLVLQRDKRRYHVLRVVDIDDEMLALGRERLVYGVQQFHVLPREILDTL